MRRIESAKDPQDCYLECSRANAGCVPSDTHLPQCNREYDACLRGCNRDYCTTEQDRVEHVQRSLGET